MKRFSILLLSIALIAACGAESPVDDPDAVVVDSFDPEVAPRTVAAPPSSETITVSIQIPRAVAKQLVKTPTIAQVSGREAMTVEERIEVAVRFWLAQQLAAYTIQLEQQRRLQAAFQTLSPREKQ